MKRTLLILIFSLIVSSAGALTIDGGSRSLESGTYDYDELRVINGGNLYINGRVHVNADSFTLDSNSDIHGSARSDDRCMPSSSYGDGGGGGYGGRGQEVRNTYVSTFGSRTSTEIREGSPGYDGGDSCNNNNDGDPGRGGSGLYLDISGDVEFHGNAYFNGGDGVSGGGGLGDTGGGGGGGGGLAVEGRGVDIDGNIYARGGSGGYGGSAPDGGRGGGGRIKIFYSSLNDNANYYVGGYDSGTIYKEQLNSPPNSPDSLSPSGDEVNRHPQISADYSDPNGDSGTLYFADGGGNLIDSCSVKDGGGCSVTYTDADQWGTSYTFQVYAEDSSGATSGTSSQTFTTNYRPSVSDLLPSGDTGQLDPTLFADVSDNDGECMTVTFRDASDNSNIGSDNICGSGTASVSTSGNSIGSDFGTTYSFDVVVTEFDGQSSVTSGDQSFTTVHRPESPSNPSPEDGASNVSTSQDLSVEVNHPDDLDMSVDFYIDTNGDDSFDEILEANNVPDGGTAEVNPDLSPGTEYTWEVKVSTGSYPTSERSSGEQSFTTNYRPSVDSINVEQLDSGHAVSFSAVVSDQDGRNQIDDCSLVVKDQDGNQYNPPVTMTNGDSGDEKICSVDHIDFQGASWSHNEDLDFELTVTDDLGLSDSGTASKGLPNHRPAIESLSTSEYPDREGFKISSLIEARDFNRSEIRSCTLVIDDGENSYSAGKLVPVDSNHVRCLEEDVGSGQFSTLTVNEEIEITLRATDIHGATSTGKIELNVPTGIDYRYSSLIITSGGVDFIPFQISNSQEVDTDFRVELRNVNASFSDSGQSSKTFTVPGRSSETLDIMVSPEIGFIGTKNLEIVTENLETGINRTHKIPVRVLEKGGSTEKPVPGPGLIQLLILTALATLAFTKSI